MFEHTLAGSMPSERSFRFGPVSAAVVIHAGVLLAVVAISVLTLHPNPGPDPPPQWVFPTLPPDFGAEPAAGGSAARREPSRQEAPAQPTRPTLPEAVPDQIRELDATALDESTVTSLDNNQGSGSGGELEGDGSGNGLGSGSGSGNGDGTGVGDGIGDGAGTDPLAIGPGIATPRLVFKVQPEYPPMARKIRLEGKVVLRAVVGPDGSVTSVELVHSSNPMFNAAAMDAVRQWRYTPPSQNGHPVSVWLNVMVTFTLR